MTSTSRSAASRPPGSKPRRRVQLVEAGARDHLVVEYLPLVRHVVSRIAAHLPPHVDNDELFQVGSMGLVNASRCFDTERGVTFKTYAYALIRGAILDELRRLDLVPRSTREKIRAMDNATVWLSHELDRKPSTAEIAARMETSEAAVRDLLRVARTVVLLSLDDSPGPRDSLLVRDILACPKTMDPCDRAARTEMIDLVAEGIGRLSDADRRVITMYYREGLLLREIGGILGVTESRVSQIHSRALARLRELLLDTD